MLNIPQKIRNLRKNMHLSQEEFANIVGVSTKTVCYWENGKNQPTVNNLNTICDILKLDKGYFYNQQNDIMVKRNINTNSPVRCDQCQNAYEIKYLEHEKLKDVIQHKNITSIFLDKELIDDVWNIDPSHLRIMGMPSEAMSGGRYVFKRNDVLIIDVSVHQITTRGIYAYTASHDKIVSVSYVSPLMGEGLEFTYANENFNAKTYSMEFLQKQNFTVLGRVIKNISFKM